jgi:hypothetical protein
VISLAARNLHVHEIAALLPLMDAELCVAIDLAHNRCGQGA